MSAVRDRVEICLLLVVLFSTSASLVNAQQSTPAAAKVKAPVSLAQLPVSFEPNVGQARGGELFLTRMGAMQIGFSADGLSMRLPGQGAEDRLRMSLVGAMGGVRIEALQPTGGESNYLLGTDASAWKTHIPQYGRIAYEDVYDGIDLLFYGTTGRVEHDFVVRPGADYRQIRLRYEGARSLTLEKDGELRVALQGGEVEVRAPHLYQETAAGRHEVSGAFVLGADDEVTFRVGAYDRSLPLVIDPVLDYATYLANLSIGVYGGAVDSAANTYIAGAAFSSSYPVTAGASQSMCNACNSTTSDVFITKLNATGTAQVYSTYLGGSGSDQPTGIAVDRSGNALVMGTTGSSDFPLKNAISAGAPSTDDGFVVSLAPDGASLNFSSRLGGLASFTIPGGLGSDAAGNVYVSGVTQSPTLPVTTGALHAGTPGYSTSYIFLMKLQATGALAYSAILGATGSASQCCGVVGLAVNGAGEVYVTGTAGETPFTTTTPWPITSGAYQSTMIGPGDAAPFVAKVSADASTLLYSTLLTTGIARGMALTPDGQVIVVGSPNYNYPLTPDAYGTVADSSFIARLSADGKSLAYSSYFSNSTSATGGTISSVAVDAAGDVFVAGSTSYTSNIPLLDPLQSVPGSAGSSPGAAFLTEFDPTMHSVLFSTYFSGQQGGSVVDGLAIDGQGRAHVVGVGSYDLPTTASAYLGTVTPPPVNYTYSYGFAALIDPNVPGPGICFSNRYSAYVSVGTTGQAGFTITNCGNAPLTISAVQLSSPVFSLSSSDCVTTLAAGASCVVATTFRSSVAQSFIGAVSVTSNAMVGSYTEYVAGQAIAPRIQAGSVLLNPVLVGSSETGLMPIENTGTAPLTVSGVVATGDFTVVNQCIAPLPASPNFYCGLLVTFSPTAAGVRTGTLTISSNDPVNPQVVVNLSATAVAVYPVPVLSSLSSPTQQIGTASVSLRVSGSNFFPQSVVHLNGVPATTTYNGSGVLTATIPASMLTGLGFLSVTVYTPGPGGGESFPQLLTLYETVAISPTFLVSVPGQDLLYAAMPASAPANANTVLPITPSTGAIGTPIHVGQGPTLMALSSDRAYLFVVASGDSALQRVNLTSGTVDRTFAFPPNPFCSGCYTVTASDLQAVPGKPTEVVLSLGTMFALYNDSGLVNYSPTTYVTQVSPAATSVSFAGSGTTLYALPFSYVGNFFTTASVADSGVSYTRPTGSTGAGNTTSGAQVISDGTLLYTSAGQVWNPVTRTEVGTFPATTYNSTSYPNEWNIALDPGPGQIYVIGDEIYGNNTSGIVLSAYGKTSLALTGAVAFPAINSPIANYLVRWGGDGFAFVSAGGTGSVLYLVESNIGSAQTNPVPVLSGASPSSAVAGGAAITVMLSGSNFLPSSTVSWNGSPLAVSYVNATQLSVTVPASLLALSGTAQITVANPAPGGGTSAGVTFTTGGTSAPTLAFRVADHTFGDAAFGLTATSNSGGAITYSVVSGPASVSGSTVTLTGAGAVVLQASQAAAGSYVAATINASLNVGKASPVVVWAQPAAISYGTALTATQLNATSTVAGSFSYSPGPGAILTAGQQSLGATFTPTDSADYASGTAANSIAVNRVALTVLASNSTRSFGSGNPTFSGTITGLQNSDAISATYSTTATATSAVGTYAITAALVDPNGRAGNYLVTQTPGVLTVTPASTTTGLTVSASTISVGGSLTLIATTTSSGGTPTGTVTFYHGTAVLGTGALSIGGVATLSTTLSAAGAASLTASYGAAGNFGPSISAPAGVTVLAPVTVAAGTTTLTLAAGGGGSSTLTITPSPGFTGSVTLSCSSPVRYITCTVTSPVNITAGLPGTATLTVTVAATSARTTAPGTGQRAGRTMLAGCIPLLSMMLVPLARRRRKFIGRVLGLTVALLVLSAVGCGGGSSGGGSGASLPPAGPQVITVTATANGATSTTTFTVNVSN